MNTVDPLEAAYNLSRSLKFENFSKLSKFRFAKFCKNSPTLMKLFEAKYPNFKIRPLFGPLNATHSYGHFEPNFTQIGP